MRTSIVKSFTWNWPYTPINLAIITVAALVCRWLLRKGINWLIGWTLRRTEKRRSSETTHGGIAIGELTGLNAERQAQRTTTVGRLLSNIGVALIVAIAVMWGFDTVGIQLTPILASAGVAGIALAFGAQTLVKDLLSGLFLIFEDQYGVGDVVEINDIKGTIEDIGLRVTRIRDFDGLIWYIRNGEITTVGNRTQGVATTLTDITVHASEDPLVVMRVLKMVIREVDQDPQFSDSLLETPTVLGVTDITGDQMTFQISTKCVAQTQYDVIRTIRRKVKDAFDEARIRGAF
ncbi:mechanosensitive ion channel family protein [Acidipropionibacterium jensenii]|nr:mechanosensitive ion channel family protein [Acidipropionibacterium jensenii]